MGGLLVSFLAERSGRERLLLGLLFGIGVPLACLFLLILPLADAHRRAQDRLVETVRLYEWVEDQAAQWGRVPVAQSDGSAAMAPIGVSGIEQRLITAGLRADVAELARGDDGGVRLRFEDVGFQAVMTWIAAARPAWGYRIAAFELARRDGPDRVGLSLSLVPAS